MRRALLASVVSSVLVAFVLAGVAFGAQGDLELIDRESASTIGNPSMGSTFDPAISEDGRYVAFQNFGDNMRDEEFGTIYVRDRETPSTTLVSRKDAADGNSGVGARDPAISADGRFVAFNTPDDDLSTADDNSADNIFVRDVELQTTTLVSRQTAADGGAGANDDAVDPAISSDGRYVVFSSRATNLSDADQDATSDVFIRDLQTETTTLVSRQTTADGSAGGDGDSSATHLSLSGDGRYVAFTSSADNLSTADDDAVADVFVRDLQAGTTTLVSRQSTGDGGAAGNGSSSSAAISGDGAHVAFQSQADNLSTADNDAFLNVFTRYLAGSTTSLVSRQSAADGGAGADDTSSSPAISSNGRYVSFTTGSDNLGGPQNPSWSDVYVRDTQASTTSLVSRQSDSEGGNGANGNSEDSSISADGNEIAFRAHGSNLAPIEAGADAYLRDQAGATTELISRNNPSSVGFPAVASIQGGFEPSLSSDGDAVAFVSSGDNLSVDDHGSRDVFLRHASTAQTELISRASASKGGAGAGNDSGEPATSGSGESVAFSSYATNLSDIDWEGNDVFVRNTSAETTRLVSRQSAYKGGKGANGISFSPSASSDGRYIAFQSGARNLSGIAPTQTWCIYLRDVVANTTRLASRQSASKGGAGAAGNNASISADGRYIAFDSDSNNLSASDNNSVQNIFVRDMLDAKTKYVSRTTAADGNAAADGGSDDPAISSDGRYVAFRSAANNLSSADNDSYYNLFVRDLETETTTLVSRQSASDGGAGADGDSGRPAISADGRYVAFQADASNLSDDDNDDTFGNIFVRDLQSDETILVSRQSLADGGAAADDYSNLPSISGDGRFVGFESDAENLSSVDKASSDVFRFQLLP